MSEETKEDLNNGISKEETNNGAIEPKKDDIDDHHNEEAQQKRLPYPKQVFFIIGNEFCERFSYYGMRTILIIYLTNILRYSDSDSTVIYHAFTVFAYFFPLLGGIIADSWLGKFNTIFYLSIVYAAGNVLLALASAKPIGLPQAPFSLLALFLIALGTGGIKPCVSSFGGDQFVVPQQEAQLGSFFSVFYFSINAGSLISTFLTPVLREDVKCFGERSCFPLAFAVPGALMIVALLIFLAGRPMYKMEKPKGNVVLQVTKCIGYAVKEKVKSKEKAEHWLDRSEPKYGRKLVNDIKVTLSVLVVFIPLPIFYTLYDQQGSAWTIQAVQMNGDMGSYTILPDQMQIINPLLILVFIPLFNYWIYPALAKCNLLKTPLQRMAAGGLLTALSFLISAGVSFALEATAPALPSAGNSQIRLYNPLNCNATINAPPYLTDIHLGPMEYHYESVKVKGNNTVSYTITGCDTLSNSTGNTFFVKEEKGYLYYLSDEGFLMVEDDISKPEDGYPLIRTLVGNQRNVNISYTQGGHPSKTFESGNYSLFSLDPGTYKLGDKNVELRLGGVYTVLAQLNATNQPDKVTVFTTTNPNSVHILWLVPQYVVVTVGEIFFSITGLEFSYEEAPVSMKSVLSAAFLLMDAIGNVIIVIIESIRIFDKQSYDMLLYAGIMGVDILLFIYIAIKYKYRNPEDNHSLTELTNDEDEKKTSIQNEEEKKTSIDDSQ